MRPLWRFLRQENNRHVLGWLGGGFMALVVGAWADLRLPVPGRDERAD